MGQLIATALIAILTVAAFVAGMLYQKINTPIPVEETKKSRRRASYDSGNLLDPITPKQQRDYKILDDFMHREVNEDA